MSSIPHATIYGRDSLRLLLVSGKTDTSKQPVSGKAGINQRTLMHALKLNQPVPELRASRGVSAC